MFVYVPVPERYLYLCFNPDGIKTDAGLSIICNGSVAKFLYKQKNPNLVGRFYATLNSFSNSLYVEKTKFSCCKLRFCLYRA